MKKDYWDEETNQLVIKWKTANQIQQFYLYKQLLPKVMYMGKGILGRYFYTDNQTDREEILWSAIDHLFVNLDKFNPDRKADSYSFCGTVLRRFMMDVCKQKKRILVVQLEYHDNLETEFEYSYSFNPFEEENPYDFDGLFQRLEGARYKLLLYLDQKPKCHGGVKKSIKLETMFLNNLTEFLYQYRDSQGLSGGAIMEHTLKTTGVNVTTANKYMKKHLGITAKNPEKIQPHKAENKIEWMQDDYTPDETTTNISLRRFKLSNSE